MIGSCLFLPIWSRRLCGGDKNNDKLQTLQSKYSGNIVSKETGAASVGN